MSEEKCVACGTSFAPPPPPMPMDILTTGKLLPTLEWHVSVRCPACGNRQDRSRRYFAVFGARHVRAFVLIFVLSMAAVALFLAFDRMP